MRKCINKPFNYIIDKFFLKYKTILCTNFTATMYTILSGSIVYSIQNKDKKIPS